jgi:hypothetical protein
MITFIRQQGLILRVGLAIPSAAGCLRVDAADA